MRLRFSFKPLKCKDWRSNASRKKKPLMLASIALTNHGVSNINKSVFKEHWKDSALLLTVNCFILPFLFLSRTCSINRQEISQSQIGFFCN